MARPRRAYDQGLVPVFGMIEYLHRGEECIKIDMKEYLTHVLSVPYCQYSGIIPGMKRLKAILVAIVIALPLSAAVNDRYAMDSPYQSVAYSGRFYDMFANPAALPMMEVKPGLIAITVNASDSWNIHDIGAGRMSFMQDQIWSVDATFLSKYIALTASFGTEFDRLERSDPRYDIYSSLKIELDAAYAFPHFSIGARISGGNQMVRRDKAMNNIGDVFTNAWLTPFGRDPGSEFFDLGIGAILEVSPFSAGIYVGKVLTLKNNNLYLGWDTLAQSTTVSAALEGGRFTKDGDLMLVRPRLSFSLTGLIDASTRKIEAEGDITFQFLPDADLTIALSYLELHHSWFRFNADNGYVSIFIRGGANGFYGSIGVVFNATDFSSFSPSLSFSYIS